jgi:hypothetical protein
MIAESLGRLQWNLTMGIGGRVQKIVTGLASQYGKVNIPNYSNVVLDN